MKPALDTCDGRGSKPGKRRMDAYSWNARSQVTNKRVSELGWRHSRLFRPSGVPHGDSFLVKGGKGALR
jgi:hypothetical protein